MKKVIFATIPRSGHHLVERLSVASQGMDGAYCESYTVEDCCRSYPCTKPSIRYQKTHDFNLDVPTDCDARYVVQYRHFLPSTISEFQLFAQKSKYNDTYEDWLVFSSYRKRYWDRFVRKWVVPFKNNSDYLLLNYDDFVANLADNAARVSEFIGIEPVDREKLKAALGDEPPRKRNIEGFKYFDQEHFYDLECSMASVNQEIGITPIVTEPKYAISEYVNFWQRASPVQAKAASAAAPAASFQQTFVRSVNQHYSVKDNVVLEIGSDAGLKAARELKDLGAKTVLATNSDAGWVVRAEPAIQTAIADPRTLSQQFGKDAVDVVIGVNQLQSLKDLPQIFSSLFDLLAPGGRCFLHGQPIWTSARGHHAIASAGQQNYHFNENNPLPPWAHLTMTKDEIKQYLAGNHVDPEAADEIMDCVFGDRVGLNHIPRRQIIDYANRSPFEVVGCWESTTEAPDEAMKAKLAATVWWDPEERFDVRGMTLLLRKPMA